MRSPAVYELTLSILTVMFVYQKCNVIVSQILFMGILIFSLLILPAH